MRASGDIGRHRVGVVVERESIGGPRRLGGCGLMRHLTLTGPPLKGAGGRRFFWHPHLHQKIRPRYRCCVRLENGPEIAIHVRFRPTC
jgi:hypothetical protein